MNITLGLPQILIIVLYALSLGIHLTNHGKDRKDKYDFWTSMVSAGMVFGLLYWGGFFS
ncbi:MAG: hypothetical protein ACRDD7_13920 [Peptostreptococcaceae bacterium]